MQLLSIAVYHHDGRRRVVAFRPGELNIITGVSKTGKSSLLGIVDYCLGRDSAPVPRTDWFSVIAWYATLWQFEDGGRVLLARQAAQSGGGTSRAMIEFGTSKLEMPKFDELRINTNSDDLRAQVGRRIGLADVQLETSDDSARGPFNVSLGNAVFYNLQEQTEIGNKSSLFHRQDDSNIARSIRDTLPFFLGAIDGQQAEKRARLRDARRALRRVEAALESAERELQGTSSELRSLLAEARAVGLHAGEAVTDSDGVLDVLNAIRFNRTATPPPPDIDLAAHDERRRLERAQFDLRQALNAEVAARDLLLDERDGEVEYDAALTAQAGRLASLGLLEAHTDGDTCPLCQQALGTPDPTTAQLSARLEQLRAELSDVSAVKPYRRQAIGEIDNRISELRGRLTAIGAALTSRAAADADTDTGNIEKQQEFVRGRIDAILSRTDALDTSRLGKLQGDRDAAQAAVDALENELNSENTQSQLLSRLNFLGGYLSNYSRQLDLEQAESRIRLDADKLTIVVDSERGELPLANIGSGENWVGYHLATHLALHQYFIEQERPVPRFLMLDQPSQAHFQSDASTANGQPVVDQDREAVRNMFKLFVDFQREFAGRFQLIVIDHADYPDEWFQSAVVHNWRTGDKLIPEDWYVSEGVQETGDADH